MSNLDCRMSITSFTFEFFLENFVPLLMRRPNQPIMLSRFIKPPLSRLARFLISYLRHGVLY